MNWFRKLSAFLVLALVVTALAGTGLTTDRVQAADRNTARNVILLIGDGMGFAQVTAARYANGGHLYMDELPYTGWVSTHSADSLVTDSAAAGSALATGYKANNDVISMTPDGRKPRTILEAAQAAGKSTGLVTTTRITHATPAVFASHIENRDLENEIAAQEIEHNVNVLFGGGKRHFLPKGEGSKREDSVDLIAKAKAQGYTYIETAEQLKALTGKENKVLGLFASSDVNFDLNRAGTTEPSLAEMTQAAIKTLSQNSEGFFLMVEGGKIDHACHANDAAGSVADTLAFDRAVKVALDYARAVPETLVVVTADHETGGMSVGAYGQYAAKLDVLKGVKATVDVIAGKLDAKRGNVKKVMAQYAGINDLSADEIKAIAAAQAPAVEIAKAINQRALIGFTSSAHTAVNVPVMALGPRASLFSGLHDNTEIARLMAEALKVTLD